MVVIKEKQIKTAKEKRLIIFSIVMNIIWVVLGVPIGFLSYMAGAMAFEGYDEGELSKLREFKIICFSKMAISMPYIIVICFILSFVFRFYNKYVPSIIVQFIPVFIILLMFI